MPRYTPSVTIGGVRIASSWSGDRLAALAGITIPWGRASVYDQTGPATARVQIIDPTGAWASDPARYGERITITLDNGRTLFRGWVDDLSVKRRKVQHPDGSGPAKVWLATLSASDELAAFAKAAPPSPYTRLENSPINKAYFESKYGTGYWDSTYITTTDPRVGRLTNIREAAAKIGLDAAITWPGLGLIDGQPWYLLAQSQGISLYDLIAQLYSLGGWHVNYNAAAHAIEAGKLAPSTGEALYLDAGTVRVAVDGDGQIIDSNHVGIPRDAEVQSTIAQNISAVRISTGQYTPHNDKINIAGVDYNVVGEPAPIDVEVPVADSSSSPLSVYNVFAPPFGAQTRKVDEPGDTEPRATSYVATIWRDIIRSINGRLTAPRVTFDLERWNYGPDAEAVILDTIDHPVSLHFPTAMFGALTGFGPAFQLIGGTLTYDSGWKLTDAVLAPAAAEESDLTLADLSANDTATLGDCDTTITVGSLRYITKGLPA
jgi:hypothetical protein